MVTDKNIKKYLLGDLAEKQKQQLETEYFENDESFELLQAVEDELFDDFVRGDLSQKQRRLFEKKYLAHDKWKNKLAFAQALYQSQLQEQPAPNSEINFSFTGLVEKIATTLNFIPSPVYAGAFVVLLAANVWLAVEFNNNNTELAGSRRYESTLLHEQDRLQAELQEQRTTNLKIKQQLAGEQEARQRAEAQTRFTPAPIVEIPSFLLQPGLLRGAESPKVLSIEKEMTLLKLKLQLLPDDLYPQYKAELVTNSDDMIWQQFQLTSKEVTGRLLIQLELPVSLFSVQSYVVRISGKVDTGKFELVREYFFTVN